MVWDPEAFDSFARCVVLCGFHVDKLLRKEPVAIKMGFVEHNLSHSTDKWNWQSIYTAWLHVKSQAKHISSGAADMFQDLTKQVNKGKKMQGLSSSVYYNSQWSTSTSPPK